MENLANKVDSKIDSKIDRNDYAEHRIYVASLSDYNAGRLHGAWIDASQEPEDIEEQVQNMLAASSEEGAEEWAIHDFEGFGGYPIVEGASFEFVSKLAQLVDKHGDIIADYFNEVNVDIDKLEMDFEDKLLGVYDSEEDFAAEIVDSHLENVPEHIKCYFNYKAFARDVLCDYITIDEPGGYDSKGDRRVYIFSC